MRNIMILALAFLVFDTSAASAADLKDSSSTYTYSSTDTGKWTGAYVGFHAAWSQSEFGHELNASGIDADFDGNLFNASFGADNWMLGGQFGVNKEVGKFVIGVEADASWADVDASTTVNYEQAHYSLTHRTVVDWVSTLRARVGYPIQRIMPYVTGGVAVANLNDSVTLAMPGDEHVERITASLPNDVRFGWALGGGVEADLGGGYSLGVEYLHIDFGDSELRVDGSNGESLAYDSGVDLDTVKIKMNYGF